MKSILIVAAFALIGTGCANPDADSEYTEPETTTDAAETGEWITLFDGTSFDAWRGYQQETMPEGWEIVDGAMHMASPGHGGDIVTKEQFADFELEFEWMVPAEGNSGVMFRVTEDHGSPWETGPEYQVLDDAHYSDGKATKNSAGSNYDVYAPSEEVARPVGEWNTGRLIADGAHVEHWLNGSKIVEYELWTDAWNADVAASKWEDHPDYGQRKTGFIAIQGDHTSVSYRNIRIRRL